jgi:hypothetical protein
MAKADKDTPAPATVGKVRWRKHVAEHDYAAAAAYLSLKLTDAEVKKIVAKLQKAELTTRRANDVLRAAGLTAAPLEDPGVMKDLIKVVEGLELSPVLVINSDGRADIADGFHRVSLVYRLDPYAEVPLKLA